MTLPQTPAAARPAVQEEPELPEIPDFPDVMPVPEQPAPKEKPAVKAEAPAPEEQKVLNWREVLDHLEKKIRHWLAHWWALRPIGGAAMC